MPQEVLPELKSAAARFIQDLGSYPEGAAPEAVVAGAMANAGIPQAGAAAIRSTAAPILRPGSATTNIVYPQFGGLAPVSTSATYASVLVVFQQNHRTTDGTLSSVTRTADVRLRRSNGRWRVTLLGSVGGEEVVRPKNLSAPAARLLDHPNADLPDTARWDVHAQRLDPRIVELLVSLADRGRIRVTVARAGHPLNVIDGRTNPPRSAHSLGLAVDVWSFDDRPVVAQRGDAGSRAAATVRDLLASRVTRQIGAPEGFDFDKGGTRVFTNTVHDDHLHLSF